MKTIIKHLIALSLGLAVVLNLVAADAPKPAAEATPAETTPPLSKKEAKQAERKAAKKTERKAAKNGAPAKPEAATTVAAAAPKEPELRLNFRGVPLDLVLNYLSEAAGYTIVLETPVKGTVDVWSNQPLTRNEAVELLNSVLNKNGYSALQNGRTLTIVSRDEAKRRDIPILVGSDPGEIPKNDKMVTQIIPVRNINATQLIRDLAPLIPTTSTVTANEGGNSLLMTDTQMNINRVAQIVTALDSTVSGSTSVKVFALKFADAKALAATIKDLFQNSGASSGGAGGSPQSRIASFFGGGGPGGGGDRGGGDRGGGDTGGRTRSSSGSSVATAARVTAVSDEHSNSLIVSASESQMGIITRLIEEVDTDVQDLTDIRVFHLKYADPVETADLLTSLFPDPTKQDTGRGGGFSFGGGPPGILGIPGVSRTSTGGRTSSGSGSSDSERQKKMGKVVAVADARTQSIVVSAAKEMMPQISEMILQLDSDPAKKQKVHVLSLENANVAEVETVLRSLFESQNSRSTANQNKQTDILGNRANTSSQASPTTSTPLNLGSGSGGGGGGQGGGGFR